MEKNILKLKPQKMIKLYLIVWLVLEVFVTGGYASISIPTGSVNYITLVVLFVVILLLILFFAILAIKTCFYEITKKGIEYHTINRIIEYPFKDILYIDIEYSKKHDSFLFYDVNGKSINMVMDKEGKLLEYSLKYCTKLISKEEYKALFPKTTL